MAKFRLNSNSVLTIGGNTIQCVVSVDLNEVADDYVSQCMSLTQKEHIAGLVDVSGTINFEVEQDADTELAYLAPGTTGALVLKPNGTTTGDLSISSTNLTVLSRDLSFSSGALTTGSAGFVCDDLTIGANT